VGLNDGTMGNSEVGHQNIGAGRVVYQDAVRISMACRENKLGDIEAMVGPIARAKEAGKAVHLMGINSDAGVHALLEHLDAMLWLCKDRAGEGLHPPVHGRAGHGPVHREGVRRVGRGEVRRDRRAGGSRAWSGATGRWTGTTGGSG
jgi:hypothetical protein